MARVRGGSLKNEGEGGRFSRSVTEPPERTGPVSSLFQDVLERLRGSMTILFLLRLLALLLFPVPPSPAVFWTRSERGPLSTLYLCSRRRRHPPTDSFPPRRFFPLARTVSVPCSVILRLSFPCSAILWFLLCSLISRFWPLFHGFLWRAC